jgi:histidinol-phosphatase (PHP family)
MLKDVVLRAIAEGFETYGLTEHAPRYRLQDLYPEEVQSSFNSFFRSPFTIFPVGRPIA